MKTPSRNGELAWRKLGPSTIIIDSRINKEVHSLNELGAFIWELLNGKNSVEQIIAYVVDNFEIETLEAQKDVDIFLNELAKKGLIQDGE